MDSSRSEPAVSGVVGDTPGCGWLSPPTWPASTASRGYTLSPTSEASWSGARSESFDAFSATRPHLELYVRWLQEVRRFRPSTVSRRTSVVAGFYRTCVIDGVLEHSPAEYVGRPSVPAESPTLGLTHLQFEATLTAARTSANQGEFALVARLGLLGLRIFEVTGSDIDDRGEEHGHRVLRVCGNGGKVVLVPLPLPLPPAVSRAIERSVDERATGAILLTSRGTPS